MNRLPPFFCSGSQPRTKGPRRLALLFLFLALPLAALGQANYATPYTFTTVAPYRGLVVNGGFETGSFYS
jgi:hypothetical protein